MNRRSGITLVELMVVLAIVALLIALLLPAIQAARESARRGTCQNNLKQIGTALLNYENRSRTLPIGARNHGTFGPSWWVGILPFVEEQDLYDRLDKKSSGNGMLLLNATNGKLVDGLILQWMLCPSSNLPPQAKVGSYSVTMPHYVGIAGATSEGGFTESRTNSCCSSSGGQISAGGMLVPNAAIALRQVLDGISKTLIVGESSDFAVDASHTSRHLDGGFPNGWVMGTSGKGTPPNYSPSVTPAPAAWNITTIKYPPGTRILPLPGVSESNGPNEPLISPHPTGVNAMTVDGSVNFVLDEIDLGTLKSLSTRDDGCLSAVPW